MTYPKPCRKVWVDLPTTFSTGFWAGNQTAVHVEWTKAKAEKLGYVFRVLQGCYHTGYEPSAGTHDKDQVLDMILLDQHGGIVPGKIQSHFFRWHYWWGWWRTPEQGFPYHFHGISGRRRQCAIGDYVPGQITDWKNKALGLKDHHTPGSDPMPYPANHATYYFPYHDVLEDTMPFTDWPKKDQDALAQAVTDRVLTAQMNLSKDGDKRFDGMSLRECLKAIYNAVKH